MSFGFFVDVTSVTLTLSVKVGGVHVTATEFSVVVWYIGIGQFEVLGRSLSVDRVKKANEIQPGAF